jgi:hypothetical protein
VLLFVDESEALTHPYLARAWAKRGADLRVPAPGQAKKIAMMGALDHAARRLVVHTSKTKRSADFIALLERLDDLYCPRPGLTIRPVVVVLDNGRIHVSKATIAALAARAHWLTVEWLPKYAPKCRWRCPSGCRSVLTKRQTLPRIHQCRCASGAHAGRYRNAAHRFCDMVEARPASR